MKPVKLTEFDKMFIVVNHEVSGAKPYENYGMCNLVHRILMEFTVHISNQVDHGIRELIRDRVYNGTSI